MPRVTKAELEDQLAEAQRNARRASFRADSAERERDEALARERGKAAEIAKLKAVAFGSEGTATLRRHRERGGRGGAAFRVHAATAIAASPRLQRELSESKAQEVTLPAGTKREAAELLVHGLHDLDGLKARAGLRNKNWMGLLRLAHVLECGELAQVAAGKLQRSSLGHADKLWLFCATADAGTEPAKRSWLGTKDDLLAESSKVVEAVETGDKLPWRDLVLLLSHVPQDEPEASAIFSLPPLEIEEPFKEGQRTRLGTMATAPWRTIDGKETKWQLECYPNGNGQDKAGHFSIYLDNRTARVWPIVDFSISLVHPDPDKTVTKVSKQSSIRPLYARGWHKFHKNADRSFLVDNKLTLKATIQLCAHSYRLQLLRAWAKSQGETDVTIGALLRFYHDRVAKHGATAQQKAEIFDRTLLSHAARNFATLELAPLPTEHLVQLLQQDKLDVESDSQLLDMLGPFFASHEPDEAAEVLRHVNLTPGRTLPVADLRKAVAPGGVLHELQKHQGVRRLLAKAFPGRTRGRDDAVPYHLKCPITHEVMKDPVMCTDGNTYEREAIERWLRTRNTSPKTNATLETKQLFPNFALKEAIAEWKDSQGGPPAKRRGAVGQGAAADGDGDEAAVPSQEDLVLSFLTNRPATA